MAETEKLMIRGDRLLLALDALEMLFFWQVHGIDAPFPRHRGWSARRIYYVSAERIGTGVTFPPPECIYMGRSRFHNSKESIGLAPFHHVLLQAEGLEFASFNWDKIVSVFLNMWMIVASEDERLGLTRWIHQIASGELTEADFREEGMS